MLEEGKKDFPQFNLIKDKIFTCNNNNNNNINIISNDPQIKRGS